MRFGSNANEAEEKARLRLLMEDLSDVMDAEALAAAIKAGKASWHFMPKLAEIVEASKDFVAARRDRHRDARLAREAAEARALPAPTFFDPKAAESKAALDEMHAAFAAAEAKEPGIRRATVDYANPDSALKPPAFSDASDGLKAMARARMGQ